MPIIITGKEFTDAWGNTTPFYRSNAGDRITMKLTMRSSIRLTSTANPIIFNTIDNELTSGGTTFESEGFRVGDTVFCSVTDNLGTPVPGPGGGWTTTIGYISNGGSTINLVTIQGIPNITNQDQFVIEVTGRNRQSIVCSLNHVDNSTPSNDFSLIDGEATRFSFTGIDSMSVGSTQAPVIIANQSGQYLESAQIKRLANISTNNFQYELTTVFLNSGLYDSTWFDSSDCLKVILKMLWSSIEDEPFAQTPIIFSDSANTGHLNQAHNTDPIDSELLQGIPSIDWDLPTDFTVIVDGPITDLGVGASYIPLNDSYFKHKIESQGRYGMVLPTSDLTVGSYPSQTNPDTGAGYEIEITSISSVGSVTTITGTFTPNSDFSNMMSQVEDGDRLFYLWIKCGNLNLLAFNDQLSTSPPVGGELIMEESKAFYDHAYNTTNGLGESTYNRFDTEDDLAYFGTFLMDNGGNYSSFRVRIEAFNTVTEEDFTLKETSFSFASTQINSSGVYLIDESVTVNPSLPTTSAKRDSILTREPGIDTLTQFGVSIYYPFILDWRYWITQLNASTDFYPTQNKNWKQYSGSGDWVVRMEVELIQDGLAFTHSDEVAILGYNAKSQVVSSIQYIRELDSSVVTSLIDGEIMRIKSKHINLLGSWNSTTWGMLTVEPKEGHPRYISSTVIDFDNNSNNPLYPIPGQTKAKLTLAADTAYIECLCDTNKLTGMNQSFTAKIKDPDAPLPPNFKTTAPDDTNKTTSSDNTTKTVA